MKHYYEDVPGLGHVALSRHAQRRLEEDGVSEAEVAATLLQPTGPDKPDGQSVLWRERGNVRLVIETSPTPFRGAKLVTTAFRIKAQANARSR